MFGVGERDIRPRLLVDRRNPDRTVAELRDIIAGAGALYDRGLLVRVVFDQTLGASTAATMTENDVIRLAHELARLYAIDKHGDEVDVEFPARLGNMYRDWREGWRLKLLAGFTSAPILRDDGTIVCAEGYDPYGGLWGSSVPDAENICSPSARGQGMTRPPRS